MTTPPNVSTNLTARSPEDLLAVVPLVLGFAPADSVVMLTFGARSTFHARIDLPGPGDVPDAVEALLEPARRHRVARVVFILYSDDARLSRRVSRALCRDFTEAGIEVVESLRADGHHWHPLVPGRGTVPASGVPYDVSAHPFAAQAVFEGRVTHGSRSKLAATLAPEPELVAAVSAAADEQPGAGPGVAVHVAADAAWVRSTVAHHVAAGTVPSDRDTARLLGLVRDLRLRDVAWSTITRGDARGHVGFWTELLRRSPADLVPAPAALLGFSAWLAGHGALAWCAVDACLEVDPDYGLADILTQLLGNAVPPTEWDRAEWDLGAGWADVFDDPA